MNRHEHWEQVYRTREPTAVSWYAAHLTDSLRLIHEVAPPDSNIIDVGGGASTLVDDLVAGGYRSITVLDIAETALENARTRLGELAAGVNWIQADATSGGPLRGAPYDVWHDRAVFHFLTEESERRQYLQTLRANLKSTGHVIIGTFALSGPEKCSGLAVVRYDAAGLQRELGPEFALTASEEPLHVTPGGKEQPFVLCRFRSR